MKNYNQFKLNENNDIYREILFIPSGEVIKIDSVNQLKKLIDIHLVSYIDEYNKTILNCYCAKDIDFDKITSFLINSLNKSTETEIKILKNIDNEIFKILNKRLLIAHKILPDNKMLFIVVYPGISKLYSDAIDEYNDNENIKILIRDLNLKYSDIAEIKLVDKLYSKSNDLNIYFNDVPF